MSIAFTCPHCGKAYTVDDSYAGQTGPCGSCHQPMTIPGNRSDFAPSTQFSSTPPPPKRSSPLVPILVVVGVVVLLGGGLLLALLLPAVQAAREAARRAQCMNNSKMLGLAFLQHEAVTKNLPLASSSPVSGIPGSVGGPNPAGFGWTVAILPYLEMEGLEEEIFPYNERMNGEERYPFDAKSTAAEFPGSRTISYLHCPSSDDSQYVDTATSDYQTYPTPAGAHPPASSSYIVLPSSHLTKSQGELELFDAGGGVEGNGVIVFPDRNYESAPYRQGTLRRLHTGLRLRSITDGTSHTVLLCETREQAYSAWIDGQATWGVGAWPGNAEVPMRSRPSDGFLGWPESDTNSLSSLAAADLSLSDDSKFYMHADRFGGTYDRMWGPSSQHAAGMIVHCFADGHVTALSTNMDRDVYLRLISRNGGEPIQYDTY